MHVITHDNADDLYDARRDVTMMFVDIAENQGRLTDANVWVRFDPLKFIDAIDYGGFDCGEIEFVRLGSAISILCDFYDNADEERPLLDEVTARYLQAIQGGRMKDFPAIVSIINDAIVREKSCSLSPWFNQAEKLVYGLFVRPYFSRLASAEFWLAD